MRRFRPRLPPQSFGNGVSYHLCSLRTENPVIRRNLSGERGSRAWARRDQLDYRPRPPCRISVLLRGTGPAWA